MKEGLRWVLRKLVSWVWVAVVGEERERVGRGAGKGFSSDKDKEIFGAGEGPSLEADDGRSFGLGFRSFLKLITGAKF